ncbi:MAG TPA: hypothetical protein VJV79_16320, partial [Polyangiaceae bacterium]|nr:hypothetical protein [Polyangiaceae bacterium]
ELEPALARRAEPIADLTSTALISSPKESAEPPPAAQTLAPVPLPPAELPAPVAVEVKGDAKLDAKPESKPESKLESKVASAPAARAALVIAESDESGSAEDVHDEFFSAGEAGSYAGGPISALPGALEDHNEHDFDDLSGESRRVMQRTPEQEARRERNIKVVSGLVGVGLAIACVALWRSHRADESAAEFVPPAAPQISNEVVRPLEPAVTALIPAPPAPRTEPAEPARKVEPTPRPVPPAPAPPPPAARPAAPAAPAAPAPRLEAEAKTKPAKPASGPPPAAVPAAPAVETRPAPTKPPTAAFPL